MYQQGKVFVAGEITVTPVVPVAIPEWMQKLVTPVSSAHFVPSFPEKLFDEPGSPAWLSPQRSLLTEEGKLLAVVGVISDPKANSVAWRRFVRSCYDPNDTLRKVLSRIGDKASEVAFICEEYVNAYGETSFSFYPFKK